jgi:murein DD-endopeptidase MepM/ murein hydrolase activator NlpD
VFVVSLCVLSSGVLLYPAQAHAGIISSFATKVKAFMSQDEEEEVEVTSQTMNVLKPVVVEEEETTAPTAEEDLESDTLQATLGSLRFSTEDIDFPATDIISVYEVKKGDTLGTVAKLFGVSQNTIVWANDLKSKTISPGDVLVILPMTGIKHTVKKGDTIASVARKYKADVEDIAKFNGVAEDAKLTVGTTILVPEGELAVAPTPVRAPSKTVKTKILDSYVNTTPNGFFVRPVNGGRRTQGIHGHNGIDIASTPGTPVMAAASGRVIVARNSGYNGGYGRMVIMMHEGNIQTVYAHLRAVYVTTGQEITQGTVIGELGNTGRSTGPHLHFEVRGAKNPF